MRQSTDARTVVGRALGLALGLALGVTLLLGPLAGPASAHDVLVGSAPGADSIQATAPDQVVLEFSDAPQPLGIRIEVTGPGGAPVGRGEPQVRGTAVVQALAADLPAGDYTVEWRIVSADGHPLSGVLAFTVAAGSTDGDAADGGGPPPVGGDTGGTAGTAAPGSRSSSAVVWIGVGALIGLGGLLVARQVRRPA